MSIQKTPIIQILGIIYTADGDIISADDIARDLTEFYEMKRKQEECDHNRPVSFCRPKFDGVDIVGSEVIVEQIRYECAHCPKCGADLTKGATHES